MNEKYARVNWILFPQGKKTLKPPPNCHLFKGVLNVKQTIHSYLGESFQETFGFTPCFSKARIHRDETSSPMNASQDLSSTTP